MVRDWACRVERLPFCGNGHGNLRANLRLGDADSANCSLLYAGLLILRVLCSVPGHSIVEVRDNRLFHSTCKSITPCD